MRVATATVGTGTITLGAAVPGGFLTFAGAGVPVGSQVSYGIEDANGNRQVDRGIYNGTTLTRTAASPTSLSGSAQVFITPLADDMITKAADIAAVPHTYLDFVNNWLWSAPNNPRNPIVCVRASVGYIDDLAGNWTLVAAGLMRRSNKGVKREEARTNSLRNNSMQGAVAGTPGTIPTSWSAFTLAGLTQTISTPTTENGVDVMDVRFNGTTSATAIIIPMEATTQIAAVVGQTWTESLFLKLQAGSLTNVTAWTIRIQEFDAGGTSLLLGNVALSAPTGTLTRQQGTRTLTQATTAFIRPVLVIAVTSGVAVDFTLRIGWPQPEQGAYASSPIRTTSASATRAADVITLNLPPTFGSAYSLFAQGIPDAPTSYATDQYLASISDGSPATNRFGVLRLASTGVPNWIINSTKTGIGSTAHAQNASGKVAARYAVSDQGGSFNGTGAVTLGTSATTPAGLIVVEIGGDGAGGGAWNGYLEKLVILADIGLDNIVLGGTAAGARLPGAGYVTALDYATTTNDDALTGHVGEFLSSIVLVGSAVALTTATPANVTSLSLTAGDWEVAGEIWFNPAGTTIPTQQIAAINTASATLPTAPAIGVARAQQSGTAATGVGSILVVGSCRISLAATTTVYLVAQSTFTVSTMGAFGKLRARRAR